MVGAQCAGMGYGEEAKGLQSQEDAFFPKDSSLWLQPPPAAAYGKARIDGQVASRGTNTKHKDGHRRGEDEIRAETDLTLLKSYRPGH